jgi:lipoprotein-anchoring transpeptidase ErfK/SrfK
MNPRAIVLVSTALVLAIPAQLGLAAGREDAAGSIAPSRATGATVAKVVVETNALEKPGAGKIKWRVKTETEWGHGPQQLLVLAQAVDGLGQQWLKVRLPIRPNTSFGWIRADFALVSHTPYWIDVSLNRRLIEVYRSGTLVRSFRAVIGAPATPTPTGLAAIYDPVVQPNPNGFVGPWVLHLTALSNVLKKFDGGSGRVGIHGRSGGSLRDPLGSARSHGCIRIDNNQVRWLARTTPRGTPVNIRK